MTDYKYENLLDIHRLVLSPQLSFLPGCLILCHFTGDFF